MEKDEDAKQPPGIPTPQISSGRGTKSRFTPSPRQNFVPKGGLEWTRQSIGGTNLVKEAKVVDNLKDGDGDGQDQGCEVYPRHPFTCLWSESGGWCSEERFDFKPCNDVVGEVRPVERSSGGGQIPTVAFKIHETKRAMQHGQQKLKLSAT